MIKRLIAVLCLLAVCLCGCNGTDTPDEATVNELCEAIKATNSQTRSSGKYMLEMTFGDAVVLYYALGNVAWDRDAATASVTFDQTYLGESSVCANYFADGVLVSVDDGVALRSERDKDTLFSRFPYAKLPEYNVEQGNIDVATTASGKTYTVVRTDTAEMVNTVIGGDIYTIANVIKKPQPEKTRYGDTVCTYTVDNGRVVGIRYEFDVKLFDTPAYVPGYSTPESEYTLDIHIVAKMSYSDFGEDVKIDEYSEPEESK